VVLSLILAASIISGTYAFLLDVPVLGVIFAALAICSIPIRLAAPRLLRARAVAFAATFAAIPPSAQEAITESQHAVDALAKKLDASGPNGFDAVEWSGVYLLGLAMVAGGSVTGYREAASEQLDLYFNGPRTREFSGDFAMISRKVRQPLVAFKDRLTTQGGALDKMEMAESHIAFDYARDSKRVALALNTLTLNASATRDGGRWRIDVRGRVAVKYPRKSRVTLVSIDSAAFRFEEGLFWALQERGLMFPYVAEWRWTLYSDDPRLL
jgi:hypothetical protein